MNNDIPKGSLVLQFLPANHYDVHTCTVEADKLSADDIQVAFWTKSPKWVSSLMKLRNSIVRYVGLKGVNKDSSAFANCIRTGGRYNMVSIPAKSDNETVLQLDDSHLTAYISVHIQALPAKEKLVSTITVVQYHNFLGRFYFFLIKPFHHLVVKGMLAKAVQHAIVMGKD